MTAELALETIYSADFRKFLETSDQPAWLRDLREKAFRYFVQKGFPAVKSEDWKYTNVAPIAKETWKVTPFPSDFSLAGEKSEGILRAFNYRRNGFAALN